MRRLLFTLLLVLAAGQLSFAQTYSESVSYDFSSKQLFIPGGLIQGSDGSFYGTSAEGGANDQGVLFKVTADGKFSTIYNFCYCNNADGSSGAIFEGGDGNFYGETNDGSSDPGGAIFKITPAGELSFLYTFCSVGGTACTDGAAPTSLIPGSDGNFYGTTWYGGAYNQGSLFKLTPGGTLTTLYSFCAGGGGCTDGSGASGLVQASDGNFYGLTEAGLHNGGTIFKWSPSGGLTTLYNFCSTGGNDCTDGSNPVALALVQGNANTLYGTTSMGGSQADGTAYKITLSGAFTKLHDFCSDGGTSCTDGNEPVGMVVASDGNLYGATAIGGGGSGNGWGTIYRVTPSDGFSTVYTFCVTVYGCADGDIPQSGIVQAANGSLYGTTMSGGSQGGGAIYSLAASPAMAAPIQLTLNHASISKGDSATLSWQVLNAYSVTQQQCFAFINGSAQTPASYGGVWTGKQTGTLSGGTLSGSTTITPTAAGTFTYALTCGGTTSGFATLTVLGSNTTTSISASPNPAYVGQQVTASTSVTASSGTPTGTVSYYYGSMLLHTSTLNGAGQATYTASTAQLAPGTYTITARYSGDTNYDPSSSSSDIVTLQAKAATYTTMTATPSTLTRPAPSTFSATVIRLHASGTPTGSVAFYYHTMYIGSGTLNGSGVATFTATSNGIPAGTYEITARYAGDVADGVSYSDVVYVTVH